MAKIEIRCSVDGDWVDILVDGEHVFGNHSLNTKDLERLLVKLDHDVSRVEFEVEDLWEPKQ